MVEILLLLIFFAVDLFLTFFGLNTYFLLLLPYVVFLRNGSVGKMLGGAFVAGMLTEQLHGLLPGVVLLGLGIALAILLVVENIIEWGHPVIRCLGFLFLLLVTIALRRIFGALMGGSFFFFPEIEWILTWLLGSTLVAFQSLLTFGLRGKLRGY